MRNITVLRLLFCPGYTFFLTIAPSSNPWTDFNCLQFKWRVVTQGCAFLVVSMTTRNFNGFKVKPPKNPKRGAWLGIFQPNRQNYKIAISPTGKIGPTPHFDRVIEPHSWVRGWSRMAKFTFKMADICHIAKCWNAIARLSIDRFRWKLGGRIPSRPRHVHHDAVAMAMAVA